MHSFSYTNYQVLYDQFNPFFLCRVSWLPIITNLGSLSQISLNEYQLKSISFNYNICNKSYICFYCMFIKECNSWLMRIYITLSEIYREKKSQLCSGLLIVLSQDIPLNSLVFNLIMLKRKSWWLRIYFKYKFPLPSNLTNYLFHLQVAVSIVNTWACPFLHQMNLSVKYQVYEFGSVC
jgi:hypothetical protein